MIADLRQEAAPDLPTDARTGTSIVYLLADLTSPPVQLDAEPTDSPLSQQLLVTPRACRAVLMPGAEPRTLELPALARRKMRILVDDLRHDEPPDQAAPGGASAC